MKKSGLTTVIIVSLAAMAFLPKNVAQWVVLAAIVVFAAVKGISYYAEHKDEISAKKEKIKILLHYLKVKTKLLLNHLQF